MKFKNIFLASTLSVIMFNCINDDDHDHSEHGEPNLVRITFKNVSDIKDSVIVQYSDPDLEGPLPTVVDSIRLKENSSYSFSIKLLDQSKTPIEDLTSEIVAEKDAHLFVFCDESSNLNFSFLETKSVRFGRTGQVNTGSRTKGILKVQLLHEADKQKFTMSDCELLNNTNQSRNKVGGETDLDIAFPFSIR